LGPSTIVGHAGKLPLHTTPPLPEVAAAQVVPPTEAVHGLLPEQATILEGSPLMSIVDSELIMVAKVALE